MAHNSNISFQAAVSFLAQANLDYSIIILFSNGKLLVVTGGGGGGDKELRLWILEGKFIIYSFSSRIQVILNSELKTFS